ncbi:MAG TPA: hypothetical protein VNU72_14430 [Puia sp.]|nr:hypothetical protein [Puia sp.]
MKWDRAFFITLVYCLFTLLYTVYVIRHFQPFPTGKTGAWFYFLEFLLVDGYAYFILLGLCYRSKNWGILLLLPIALLLATIIVGFLFVWLLRIGGGTLLDRDSADMVLASLLFLSGSVYARKWIRPGKASGRKGPSKRK